MTTQTCAQKYYNAGEVAVATRLIKFLVSQEKAVAIWEGEGWAIKRSTSVPDLLAALASTGEDKLVIYPAEGNGPREGFILLVWGNEADGSELIADHSDNEVINSLIRLGGF